MPMGFRKDGTKLGFQRGHKINLGIPSKVPKEIYIENGKRIRGENNPSWKGGKTKLICKNCSKIFFRFPSRLKVGGGLFCSRKCYNIWREDKITRVCKICGKAFLVKPYTIKRGVGKFCSKKCRGLAERGENNPAWKGGISTITDLIRQSTKYKEWRSKIFARDGYSCQRCSKKGGELAAHHKKPFNKFIAEIKRNSPLLSLFDGAMIYKPLWDLTNGITYCEKCHKKVNTRR